MTPLVVLAVLASSIGLIGFAQYAISQHQAPFAWPYTAWLDLRFHRVFHTENALAFAVPLFVIAGVIFAALAPAVISPPEDRWTISLRETSLRRWAVVALAVPILIWAWLNLRLVTGHADHSGRWLFFVSIGAVLGVLAAVDRWADRLPHLHFKMSNVFEVAAVAAITGTFIGINCRDLENWRYASIGDDGEFFSWAHNILAGSSLNWFSQSGPYGYHPILSSVWQALVMRVFGDDMYGWKMASLVTIALSLPPFYLLVRQILGVRVAVFSTLFLGASHYLFAYAHTGYDNIFPILPTVTCLALLFGGMKRGSYSLLFAAGLFAGMGFYTFFSSRTTIVIAVGILLTADGRRVSMKATTTVCAGFAMFVLPIFASDGWFVIRAMTDQSITSVNEPLFEHLRENIVRTLFGFNFSPGGQHYVVGNLMDEISATLAVGGFFVALARVRHASFRSLMLWYGLSALSAGVLSRYIDVSTTRLHYVLPPVAVLAGIAVDRLLAAAGRVAQRPILERALGVMTFAVLAPTVFIVNGQHFFGYSAKMTPTTVDTVLVREVTSAACSNEPLRTVVYHSGPDQLLDSLWEWLHMGDRKPLEMGYQYVPYAYNAYPSTGGVGCVMAAPLDRQGADRVLTLMRIGVRGERDFRIVSDMTHRMLVALAPPSERRLDELTIGSAWRTDLSKGSGLEGVVKGQEKAFMQPVDTVQFESIQKASLTQPEPVIVVTLGGEARAYPVRTLTWRGVVNDTVGDLPIVVTFDAIAGTARVFRRDVDGQTLSFGLSGLLRGGNALLYDRQSESWWQQITGDAITGETAGKRLTAVPFVVSSWLEFAATYPHGLVLDAATIPDMPNQFLGNPYLGYDVPDGKPIFTLAPVDTRLPAMRHVAVVDVAGRRLAIAFPDNRPAQRRVLTLSVDGKQVVLFFDGQVTSMLDRRFPWLSRSLGTFAAFEPSLQGQALTFRPTKDAFVDDQTQSVWSLVGRAVGGRAFGAQLTPETCIEGFWFAISAAYPGIELVQ